MRIPTSKPPSYDQITFLLYPNEVNCMLKGLERPGIDSGMPFWISHVRLEGLSRQRLSREKECVPDLKTSELDQITFLLYPNEVNCMLKGLERPGIDSGMSNLDLSTSVWKDCHDEGCQGKRMESRPQNI